MRAKQTFLMPEYQKLSYLHRALPTYIRVTRLWAGMLKTNAVYLRSDGFRHHPRR
jgi:hypothetical protein